MMGIEGKQGGTGRYKKTDRHSRVTFCRYVWYDMKDKIIGFLGLNVFMIGAIAYAIYIENAAGSFRDFTSIPSFLIVIAFGVLTYMKKDKYKFHKLGAV